MDSPVCDSNSEFTQQDGKTLLCDNVTGLLLASFVVTLT